MCGDIVDQLPLSQATVSQHLKELKKADLIWGNVEGPKVCYSVNSTILKTVRDNFSELFENVCCETKNC